MINKIREPELDFFSSYGDPYFWPINAKEEVFKTFNKVLKITISDYMQLESVKMTQKISFKSNYC